MKRFMVVLNVQQPDYSCIDFACRMADYHKARVCGLFLESLVPESAHPEPAALPESHWAATGEAPPPMDTEETLRYFKAMCARKGQEAEAHFQEGAPLPYVVRESWFADLLLLHASTSFGAPDGSLPSPFTRSLLREAHCPVLLAPRSFEGIDETIFCYDGSPSAIQAAKLYTYLLPGLTREKATVLEVDHEAEPVFDNQHRSLLKWMRSHYRNVEYRTMRGEPSEELLDQLFRKRNKLVVMGAYGRGPVSTLLRPSTADRLIGKVDLPFFISHL